MGASPQLAPKDRESHVLVAADDITLSHIHLLLSKSGYAVVPVRDGAQALSTLQSEDAPTLAVLDGTLPGISGAEICRRIRSTGQRSLYIILLTRWNQQNERVEGLEAFVCKPDHNSFSNGRCGKAKIASKAHSTPPALEWRSPRQAARYCKSTRHFAIF